MKYFRISRSVKKPFHFMKWTNFHKIINFTKWLRHILRIYILWETNHFVREKMFVFIIMINNYCHSQKQ
jgi:hypothetical protein